MTFPGLTVATIDRFFQATLIFFYVLPPVQTDKEYTAEVEDTHATVTAGSQFVVGSRRLTSTSLWDSHHYSTEIYSHIECQHGERLH